MSEMIKKMIRSEFDKEIEIPDISLENINKALKEMGRITNEILNPFDSAFDKIVKDIRDRQDNVIAMEFTKCIGELLKKNGVLPKMTEYTRNFETDNTFETRYGVSIDELDFSEHDKVFEDKIEKLEKELEEWKAEAREIKKNRDEQLKSFRKAVEPYVDIGNMHETIAELKQRIAELEIENKQLKHSIDKMAEIKSKWIDRAVEWKQKCEKLESKETEKPRKINLNDRIKVKLTPLGAEIYYHQYDDVNKRIKGNGGTELEPMMPQIDKDGYTEFQLWHFMELYVEHMGMCKPNVIEPLDIVIAE